MKLWSPSTDLEKLVERMDNLLSESTGFPRLLTKHGDFALDMQETDDSVVVTASLPGFTAADLDIEISKGLLTIRGESKEEREESKGTWHLRERRFGSVQRTVTLPAPVYEDEAKAKLENGVLTVTVPKSERTPTRRIEIETK